MQMPVFLRGRRMAAPLPAGENKSTLSTGRRHAAEFDLGQPTKQHELGTDPCIWMH